MKPLRFTKVMPQAQCPTAVRNPPETCKAPNLLVKQLFISLDNRYISSPHGHLLPHAPKHLTVPPAPNITESHTQAISNSKAIFLRVTMSKWRPEMQMIDAGSIIVEISTHSRGQNLITSPPQHKKRHTHTHTHIYVPVHKVRPLKRQ